MGTFVVILSSAVLPPGFEDEAFCPVGACIRDIRRPGTVGSRSASVECYDPTSDEVYDEVWTGSLSDTVVPPGWVKVASNLDASFSPLRCAHEHSHGLPELPNQFETWVTCNILNKNYTTVIHEVYDEPGNRAVRAQLTARSRWPRFR